MAEYSIALTTSAGGNLASAFKEYCRDFKIQFTQYMLDLGAQVGSPKKNTLPEQEAILLPTFRSKPTALFYHYKDEDFNWIEPDLLGFEEWETMPRPEDLDTTEIWIDLQDDQLDLSLLNENEREFLEVFVGTFNPGPNFTKDDLIIDDIY